VLYNPKAFIAHAEWLAPIQFDMGVFYKTLPSTLASIYAW
jgi:hypothetical protein